MRIISYFILLLLLILGISFAVLNAETVTLNYYIGQKHFPLSLLLVLTFTLGCLLGVIVGIGMYLRMKSQNFKLKSRIKIVEKEVENLRTMPLHDNR